MQILFGFIGMASLILIAVLLSSNRRAIKLRTVGFALLTQVIIGAFVLYVPVGQRVLGAISQGVSNVINYCDAGISFLFGGIVSEKMTEFLGAGSFIFAIRVLPLIIFFSALIAILYYLGIMQFVIRLLGGSLNKLLGTSRTESMSATANIFVGLTEAPLIVRPYLNSMTKSELFAVMTGGVASVAGSVIAGYAQLGIPLEYLIAASFMAAPGGLLFAKLMVPETEKYQDDPSIADTAETDKPANVIDAAAAGASSGVQLAINVGAMLIAFVSLIALINGMLGGIGGWFDFPQLSLELILGWLFSPLAVLIGIPMEEALTAGSFIGQKFVVNEFVAYMNFSQYLDEATVIANHLQPLSKQSQVIISFALCGFANLGSIAILIGGIGSLAPSRRHDIARMGLKAIVAATLSNLMSATIAGILISFS